MSLVWNVVVVVFCAGTGSVGNTVIVFAQVETFICRQNFPPYGSSVEAILIFRVCWYANEIGRNWQTVTDVSEIPAPRLTFFFCFCLPLATHLFQNCIHIVWMAGGKVARCASSEWKCLFFSLRFSHWRAAAVAFSFIAIESNGQKSQYLEEKKRFFFF